MNEMYFRIASIQKQMDSNQNLQFIMKGLGILLVLDVLIKVLMIH